MEEVRTCHNSISIASDLPNSLYNILCLPRRWSSSPRRNILLTNGNRTISSRYQAVELAEHIIQQITYTWYTQYTFTQRQTALNSSTKVSSLEVSACVSVTVSLIVKFCKNCFTSIVLNLCTCGLMEWVLLEQEEQDSTPVFSLYSILIYRQSTTGCTLSWNWWSECCSQG